MHAENRIHRFVPALIILAAAGVLINRFPDVVRPVSHNPAVLGLYDIDRFLYIVFYTVAILGTIILGIIFIASPARYSAVQEFLRRREKALPWGVAIALLANLAISMIAYELKLSALFGSIQLAILLVTLSAVTIVPETFSSLYEESFGKLSQTSGGYLGLLLVIGTGTMVCFLFRGMRIAGPDNLLALGLTQSRLIDLITKNTLHFPAYRPVPYLTVWIQYRLNDAPRALISGNGIIMILCGVMLYLIVYRETQSPYIAAIAGVLLITEPRILPSYQWLGERQASLSALFGLIVMYLVMYNRSRYRFVGIGVFLLLSTLSKEYGLAFHVFTIVFLLMNKPDDYLKVGIATWWLRSYSFCCGDWSFEAL